MPTNQSVREAIEIVNQGKYEVTWNADSGAKYNTALEKIISIAQQFLGGQTTPPEGFPSDQDIWLIIVKGLEGQNLVGGEKREKVAYNIADKIYSLCLSARNAEIDKGKVMIEALSKDVNSRYYKDANYNKALNDVLSLPIFKEVK